MILYKLIKNTPRIVSICSRRQFYINKDIFPLYSTFLADRQQLLVSCKVSPGETYDDDDAGTTPIQGYQMALTSW